MDNVITDFEEVKLEMETKVDEVSANLQII